MLPCQRVIINRKNTMNNLEPAAAQWAHGALVFVQLPNDEDTMVRPAAFVFERPGGLLWVEPCYADPAGASGFALHDRDGEIRPDGSGFVLTSAGEHITVLPYDPKAGDADMIDGALEWFADHLHNTGRTWAEERERVRDLVLNNSQRMDS